MRRYAIIEYEVDECDSDINSYDLPYMLYHPNIRILDSYPIGAARFIADGNICTGFHFTGPFSPNRYDDYHKICNKTGANIISVSPPDE